MRPCLLVQVPICRSRSKASSCLTRAVRAPLTDIIDPIGPIGFLFNSAIYRLRDDPKLINLHQALSYMRAAYMRFAVTVTIRAGAGVTLRQAVASSPRSFSADYTMTMRTNRGKWLVPVPGRAEEIGSRSGAFLTAASRLSASESGLTATPADGAVVSIRVRATAELEDPHLRLVALLHPLPAAGDEGQVFTDELLSEMLALLPTLAPSGLQTLTWSALSEAQKAWFREHYRRFLMLRESGRLVTLDTANLVLDLEISSSSGTRALQAAAPVTWMFAKPAKSCGATPWTTPGARRSRTRARSATPISSASRSSGARSDLQDVIAVADSPDE